MLVDRLRPRFSLPPRAGVGLKPEHYADLLEKKSGIGWLELHPENYLGAGGPPHHFLERLADLYPLSFHGVGLSIGGADPVSHTHLRELRQLADRYRPVQFSEHLAWSSYGGQYFNDLLPLPYTGESLALVADHVDAVQQALGRAILIENPTSYLRPAGSTLAETEFLDLLSLRTGCGLLLDVNNVYVSALNNGFDAQIYLDGFPLARVGEIHLAGHSTIPDGLLLDSHDCAVAGNVWNLYGRVLERTGPVPTLIEWDGNIPQWPVLQAEAAKAEALLRLQALAGAAG